MLTALHSCSSCGRHPSTHAPTGDDRCGACGLGDEREEDDGARAVNAATPLRDRIAALDTWERGR